MTDLAATCKHDRQRRKCPVCERDTELERLRAELRYARSYLTVALEEYEAEKGRVVIPGNHWTLMVRRWLSEPQ